MVRRQVALVVNSVHFSTAHTVLYNFHNFRLHSPVLTKPRKHPSVLINGTWRAFMVYSFQPGDAFFVRTGISMLCIVSLFYCKYGVRIRLRLQWTKHSLPVLHPLHTVHSIPKYNLLQFLFCITVECSVV